MPERFKAVVRRRTAEDDAGCGPEDIWPPELRWVADWDRHDAEDGTFISGCTVPHLTHADALAEAVAEADKVRRANGRCPKCGHRPHGRYCLNMASDNDCACRYVAIEVEGTHPTEQWCEHHESPSSCPVYGCAHHSSEPESA